MADRKTIDADEIERAGVLFQEIAHSARVLRWLATTDDESGHADALAVLEAAIARVGWLADLGSATLGGPQVMGAAENWLLPPACQVASDCGAPS